jgi:TRAF3-interacting protein 1
MINCVYLYLGGFPVDDIVKSSKIVAGKEPEKTNMFLQHLAVAASRCKAGASCAKAVRDTLSGVQPSADDKGSSQPATVTMASAPKSESKTQESLESAPSRPKPVKATSRFDDDRGSTTNISSSTPPPASNSISVPASTTVSDRQMDHEDESKSASNTLLANESSGGHENETSIKRVERPRTARKKPPKLKENSNEESKTGSKNTAAPVGIFVDGENNNDNLNDSDDEQASHVNKSAGAVEVDGDANHSKLVQKILEEEKKQDNKKDKGKDKTASAKDDDKSKDDAGGIRMGKIRKAQRGNETSNAPPVELNELRLAIQKLTQSTNPLGKCMDYVHDDLEIMRYNLADCF